MGRRTSSRKRRTPSLLVSLEPFSGDKLDIFPDNVDLGMVSLGDTLYMSYNDLTNNNKHTISKMIVHKINSRSEAIVQYADYDSESPLILSNTTVKRFSKSPPNTPTVQIALHSTPATYLIFLGIVALCYLVQQNYLQKI